MGEANQIQFLSTEQREKHSQELVMLSSVTMHCKAGLLLPKAHVPWKLSYIVDNRKLSTML